MFIIFNQLLISRVHRSYNTNIVEYYVGIITGTTYKLVYYVKQFVTSINNLLSDGMQLYSP